MASACAVTAFIQRSISTKVEQPSETRCEKIGKIAFIISSVGGMAAASSANFYNAPTAAFCSRSFPGAEGFTTGLFETANGMTFSSIWAGAYINLLLSPSLTPTEREILLPKNHQMRRTLLKILAIVLGLANTFPSILDRRLKPSETAIQMFTQSGLFAYSLRSAFNLLSRAIESGSNEKQVVKLLLRSIGLRILRIDRQVDADPKLNLCRAKLVQRVQENLQFFNRAPKEVKADLANRLNTAKASDAWVKEALNSFHRRTEIKKVAHTALATSSTALFSGSQLTLVQQLAAQQIDTTLQDPVASNFLALLPTLALAPITYECIGESIDSLISFIEDLFQGHRSPNVAETVAPHFVFRAKLIYGICSLLCWAQTVEMASDLGFSTFWQVIMSMAAVLFVSGPGLSAIDDAAKVIFLSKNSDQTISNREDAVVNEKMLFFEAESNLIRFLAILKQCSSSQLYQFVIQAPDLERPLQPNVSTSDDDGSPLVVNSPLLPSLKATFNLSE
jgi:hypothetical protein